MHKKQFSANFLLKKSVSGPRDLLNGIVYVKKTVCKAIYHNLCPFPQNLRLRIRQRRHLKRVIKHHAQNEQ